MLPRAVRGSFGLRAGTLPNRNACSERLRRVVHARIEVGAEGPGGELRHCVRMQATVELPHLRNLRCGRAKRPCVVLR